MWFNSASNIMGQKYTTQDNGFLYEKWKRWMTKDWTAFYKMLTFCISTCFNSEGLIFFADFICAGIFSQHVKLTFSMASLCTRRQLPKLEAQLVTGAQWKVFFLITTTWPSMDSEGAIVAAKSFLKDYFEKEKLGRRNITWNRASEEWNLVIPFPAYPYLHYLNIKAMTQHKS